MRTYLVFIFSISFLFLTLSACNNSKEDTTPKISFYYWKTNYKLTDYEKKLLKANQVNHLYLRYFDIGLVDGVARPMAPINFYDTSYRSFKITPVIFIKNEVLLDTMVTATELAVRILDYVNQIDSVALYTTLSLQIDCDWSLKSKAKYHALIHALKSTSNRFLSTTLRLHQVKYVSESGIPEVNQVVLMYYNMGKIAPDDLNSIYDRNIAQQYIYKLKLYPLDMNIALPIYNWAILIRNGKVINLLSKFDESQLKDGAIFEKLNVNKYQVKKGLMMNNQYLLRNDIIKIEHISQQQLFEMADDLKKNLRSQPKEIIFYDLDEINLKNYAKELYEKTADRF